MTRPVMQLEGFVEETEASVEENWMISYIDVFVLMTTLFVLLVFMQQPELAPSSAAEDDADVSAESIFDVLNQLPASEAGIPEIKTIEKEVSGLEIETLLLNSIAENGLEHVVEIKQSPDKMQLEIQSRVLFHSGHADLTRPGIDVLESLLPILRQSAGLIHIEGHTDDLPIETIKYPSNWELAAARATEVLKFFVLEGMEAKRFRAVSFGDTQPLVPNTSESNRRKNRRVSLVIESDSQALDLNTH